MVNSSSSDQPIVSGEPLVPVAAETLKTNMHITVTQGASTKITMEEAEMLVKFVWPEIVKSEHNSFSLPKIGLSIVRDGDQLFIMTLEEKEAALNGVVPVVVPGSSLKDGNRASAPKAKKAKKEKKAEKKEEK